MGKNDDETRDDTAETAAPDDSEQLDHEEKEEAANLAGLSAQLRGLYKGLLDEPIPDRFMQLLKELESKESETR
jgi:hypothetical protein